MNNRSVGAANEELAASYLENVGYKILDKNFRCRLGEIDLVAMDENDYLCFIEVKYRKSTSFPGSAESAVDSRKQMKICKTSDYYRMLRGISDKTPVRYDVVVIYGKDVKLYKNAFQYIGF